MTLPLYLGPICLRQGGCELLEENSKTPNDVVTYLLNKQTFKVFFPLLYDDIQNRIHIFSSLRAISFSILL